MQGFSRGINLGGWLSQYAEYDHEHFRTFITEADIAHIASWGLDHVRLPIDYPVIEEPDRPGMVRETGYAYIDSCISWCFKHGLGVVLDIHEAPGFTFRNDLEEHTKERNLLFDSEQVQDRFVALWEEIVRRYREAPVPIIFELLNEVTLPSNDKWNDLVARTVPAIRAIAPEATIMIGGTFNNGIRGLENLIEFADDPHIVYTFHSYDPLMFTHQNAYWSAAPRTWGEKPNYPGELPRLAEFMVAHPEFAGEVESLVGRHIDRSYLEEVFQPAIDFAARTKRFVYCGEFGVAAWVAPESRRRWLSDFMSLVSEHGFGSALWTYKEMDFGVVDAQGTVMDPEYLTILRDSA
jgi:endoglucanase